MTCVLVFLIFESFDSKSFGQHEPFLPLAGVEVSLSETQVDDFMDIVTKFGQSNHFRIDAANFPKRGRTVANIRIEISEKTFFKINNFRNPAAYELVAYSHESTEVWQKPWDTLISTLSSAFGSERVTPMRPH